MISDVYTREVRAKTLLDKRPETVNAAMQEILPTRVDKTDFAITTDAGKEFSRLEEGGIPAEAVHRAKQCEPLLAQKTTRWNVFSDSSTGSYVCGAGDAR